MDFGVGLVLALIALGVALYFLPSIVAKCRNGKDTKNIFIINLFLGWTTIAWIMCAVWSFISKEIEEKDL